MSQTRARFLSGLSALALITSAGTGLAQEEGGGAPRFQVDPDWPKPLPNNWRVGQIAGIAVGPDDTIYVLNRPRSLSSSGAGATAAQDGVFVCETGGEAMDEGASCPEEAEFDTAVPADAFGNPRPDGPLADAALPAPAVLTFDAEGNLTGAWGGPETHGADWGWPDPIWTEAEGVSCDWPANEHGIHVDDDGNVYIGGNGQGDGTTGVAGNDRGWDGQVLKFSPEGECLLQVGGPIPPVDEAEEEMAQAGMAEGDGTEEEQAAAEGQADDAADAGDDARQASAEEEGAEADAAEPQDEQSEQERLADSDAADGGANGTPRLYRPANAEVFGDELYIADGYGNRRVVVVNKETGEYRRHWGAYGDVSVEDDDPGPFAEARPAEANPPAQFRTPVHCVRIADDETIYVCDRVNNRIQVFDMSVGTDDGCTDPAQEENNGCGFLTETFVRADTLGPGSVWDLALSPDEAQSCLHQADGTNQQVYTLSRETLAVLDAFGGSGRGAGMFHWIHDIAADSEGNLYTSEVDTGMRAQRFERVEDAACDGGPSD